MSYRNQVIFWSIILVALTVFFGQGQGGLTGSFYFVCMLLPVAVGTSWFFNDILVPDYLMKNRYWKFALYLVYSMIVSLWAQMFVIILAFIVLANFHLDQLNTQVINIRLLAFTIYGIVFLQAFINMYQRFMKASQTATELAKERAIAEQGHLNVTVDRKQRRILFSDILYVESLSDYVQFVLKTGSPVTTRETISNLEKRLPAGFIRVHRSFIVRKDAILSFTREEVRLQGDHIVSVGRKYRKSFIEEVDQRG